MLPVNGARRLPRFSSEHRPCTLYNLDPVGPLGILFTQPGR